jgi:hypothetical protein
MYTPQPSIPYRRVEPAMWWMFYILCSMLQCIFQEDPGSWIPFQHSTAQKANLKTKSVLLICESALKYFANFKKPPCDSFQSKWSTQMTQNVALWWGRLYILIKIEDHRHYLCQYHVVEIAPCPFQLISIRMLNNSLQAAAWVRPSRVTWSNNKRNLPWLLSDRFVITRQYIRACGYRHDLTAPCKIQQ